MFKRKNDDVNGGGNNGSLLSPIIAAVGAIIAAAIGGVAIYNTIIINQATPVVITVTPNAAIDATQTAFSVTQTAFHITEIAQRPTVTRTATAIVPTATRVATSLPPTAVPTALPDSAIILNEDFEDGRAQDINISDAIWSFIDDGTGENRILRIGATNESLNISFPFTRSLTNYAVQTRFLVLEEYGRGNMGFQIRANSPCPGYYLSFTTWNNISFDISGADCSDTGVSLGGYSPIPEVNRWHELRIVAIESNFEIYLNGEQIIWATDDTFQRGGFSITTYLWGEVWFDDIVIWSLDD